MILNEIKDQNTEFSAEDERTNAFHGLLSQTAQTMISFHRLMCSILQIKISTSHMLCFIEPSSNSCKIEL